MPKYTVYKDLLLSVEVEAEDRDEAIELAAQQDDHEFAIVNCQYSVDPAGED